MIEFKAKKEKYAVTVFTDITCGYCVRLHNQIPTYNELGITVRYMAYLSSRWKQLYFIRQMAAIWGKRSQICDAEGKVERKFPEKTKDLSKFQKIIKEHYQLGRELGINGTPAIFLPTGEMVGGYLPPDQLIKRLQQTQ